MAEQEEKTEQTTCCVVGAGPGGAMLALLLARQGIPVVLLEEHMDFDRDFRGDTVHPSTMQVMEEIGLADKLLQLPHAELHTLSVQTDEGSFQLANFHRLKTHFSYVAMIPQADFLQFVTGEAKQYPAFKLVMGARAEKLIEEDGYVHGVQYRGQDGWHELRAVLTVGADGRFSRMRKLAGFEPVAAAQSMDVLWFRLPRKEEDDREAQGRLGKGHILVILKRADSWQIGYIIPKGGYQKLRSAGMEVLHRELAALLPDWADRLDTLREWKQISVLSVESSRLKRWYRPGLLLIGDAAHVMSPIGGVGINYAIQDAVVAANILGPSLKARQLRLSDLAKVQREREWPTRLIQGFQNFMQSHIIAGALNPEKPLIVPAWVRFLLRVPLIGDLPARLIAFGPRTVHVCFNPEREVGKRPTSAVAPAGNIPSTRKTSGAKAREDGDYKNDSSA
jgi:2-polyprenyl-6-methoxyphenol hydroxylase-like FAD-dependent oxidoreductase